jgi:hypothetical protein
MIISNFTHSHVAGAAALALANYNEERLFTPALPPIEAVPPLERFADFGLGVAALDGERLLGFLCFYPPIEHAFTTSARGTFSPIHAHGAVKEDRGFLYRRLYQAAAEKLVQAKISSHAVALYAHDVEAIRAFFTNGFGLRCVDAVRPMEPVSGISPCFGYDFKELDQTNKNELLPLKNALIDHLGYSPAFMYYPHMDEEALEEMHRRRNPRYFTASYVGDIIAFLEVMDSGENFACDDASMQNICGAYCKPEHRGRGVYQNLLNYTINTLKTEGYTRFGVDFESFNPTANAFWLKYFSAYTNSVVRRIDENIFGR